VREVPTKLSFNLENGCGVNAKHFAATVTGIEENVPAANSALGLHLILQRVDRTSSDNPEIDSSPLWIVEGC
jgi:hypothetical protein